MKALRITLLGVALGCAAAPALAGEWRLFPIADKGYRPDLTISRVGGMMDPEHVSKDSYVGVEVAMNCGLLETPSGVVRTKLSYGQFDKDGTKLRIF